MLYTTGKPIIFATDTYADINPNLHAGPKNHMTVKILKQLSDKDDFIIQPRVCKSGMEQKSRTKKRAEVFIPSWICNKMNNYCDKEWFGKDDVFNKEDDVKHTWIPMTDKIPFDTKFDFVRYVKSRRLEITCGEAPFIVSRYDTTSGDMIPLDKRIGILDRKMRVINENSHFLWTNFF